MNSIPTIDFSSFLTSNESEQRHVAAAIVKSCSLNGCVNIKGHGFSTSSLEDALKTAQCLFALPYEEKMKAPHPKGLVPHRGYSGADPKAPVPPKYSSPAEPLEKVEPSNRKLTEADYSPETYETGAEENKENYNIWLPESSLPGFRERSLGFYWQLQELSSKILHAFILGLGLDEEDSEYVHSLHKGYDNQLRYLHYSSIPQTAQRRWARKGAHNDWSLFTLLFQDAVGGLEFHDIASGVFMPVIPEDGTLHLVIGDMLMRVSNGRLPSCKHRVVIPECKEPKQSSVMIPDRYSLAYFVAPELDDIIYPPASLIARDGKMVYTPVVFRRYSDAKFKGLGSR